MKLDYNRWTLQINDKDVMQELTGHECQRQVYRLWLHIFLVLTPFFQHTASLRGKSEAFVDTEVILKYPTIVISILATVAGCIKPKTSQYFNMFLCCYTFVFAMVVYVLITEESLPIRYLAAKRVITRYEDYYTIYILLFSKYNSSG